MPRKRFNADEKVLLIPGTPVEWRNGSHWHPGVILGGLEVRDGWQYAALRNLATTQTISPGDHFRATPGAVRPRP